MEVREYPSRDIEVREYPSYEKWKLGNIQVIKHVR
jgi:hypothetical protein